VDAVRVAIPIHVETIVVNGITAFDLNLVSPCFQFSGVGKLFHAAEDLCHSVVASIDRNLHGLIPRRLAKLGCWEFHYNQSFHDCAGMPLGGIQRFLG
jgi:hypothetical protein